MERAAPTLFGSQAEAQEPEGPRRSGVATFGGGGSLGGSGTQGATARPPGAKSSGPSRASPWGWGELSVEVNGASREFSVPIDQVRDKANRDEASFKSSIFVEAGARLALYPGALATDGWAAGLGLEGSFHHHVYLKAFNKRVNQEVESREYSFSAGGVYRAPIGSPTHGITLYVRAGYGRYAFELGDMYNDIVPPMVYDHIYAGIKGHIPVLSRHAGIDIGGGYLAVFNIGAVAMKAYNGDGMLPTPHGFTFNAGVSGEIIGGLKWSVGFEMLGFVTTHEGVGWGYGIEPSSAQDLDGRGIQTTGAATDIHWRVIPQLSYRFGWNPEARVSRPGGREEGEEREDWYDSGDRSGIRSQRGGQRDRQQRGW